MPISSSTHDLTTRLTEISHLWQEQDLSRLSRRILDFLADVQPAPSLRSQAIRFRAAYNTFISLEQEAQSDEAWTQLIDQGADLMDAFEATFPIPNTPGVMAPPVEEASISVEKTDVFVGQAITKKFVSAKHTFELPPLDIRMRLGEITGVVGENGNGKTTLLRIVAGELNISGGKVLYPGLPGDTDDWYQIKQRIAFIPQALKPWPGYLKENLHFTAAIHGIKGRENEDLVDFMIHRLGLSRYEDSRWSEISSGFKLRFELARALIRRPTLLIIDEPLANLDINTQQIFLQDLRYLADAQVHPVSILLSSQHLHEVEAIADRLVFIKNGEALFNGRREDFGQDRSENIFELGTSLSEEVVVERLRAHPELRLRSAGQHLVLHTPVAWEAERVLSTLLAAQVPVNYFRDISTSTLRLFRTGG
ncbi:MAG: ABC transporter ATP-binding protein [Bacteroidota bacterium]